MYRIPCIDAQRLPCEVSTRAHDPFISQIRDCNLVKGAFLHAGVLREVPVGDGFIGIIDSRAMDRQLEDLWLQAGDSLAVESGEQLLVEAWPSARFQLLVPPQACRTNWRTNGRMTLGRISGWFSWAKPQPA